VAETPQNLLGKLADAGEDAISKVGDMPGLNRLSAAVTNMRERLDEMQKRLRGLDDIERRLDVLEKRVAELSKPKRTTRSSPAKKSATG
jgi:uncharacterized coiled-coil protein SlyX